MKRRKSKLNYDRHAKELPKLQIGQTVRMSPLPTDQQKRWQFGTCSEIIGKRSYIIDCDGKQYRRNRRDIRPTNEQQAVNQKAVDVDLDLNFDNIDNSEPVAAESVTIAKDRVVQQTPPSAPDSVKKHLTPKPSDNPNIRSSRSRIIKLPSKYDDFHVNLKS
ncbi:hypothetical protein FSP39_021817 [Pinctada imbricata]|uniref:Uncharacterized protein n=1 Tax=Pinctada imbricata TaxID=66713 RepID=A0AA89C7Y6_PINIB|nr:hypothetical protein FSP39_021817 [Pinctada imbricata]